MKVLIIGLGSIARKHIYALRKLEPDSVIYALRSSQSSPEVDSLKSCYSLSEVPLDIDFIIISNPTSLHLQTIKKVIHFGVPLFIEKPPIDNLEDVNELLELVDSSGLATYTAFNLRFHPVVQWLKERVNNFRVLEVNSYCGSFLPDWRPNQDYRQVYSARQEMGGGVHLDLTHEIDYLLWIFGYPTSSNSLKRKLSDLEINSIDSAKYWMEYNSFTINLTLNYFRKDPKRFIEIVTNQTTLGCDLLANKITDLKTGEILFESNAFTTMDTYEKQMNYFIDCVKFKRRSMNTLTDSVSVMEICLK